MAQGHISLSGPGPRVKDWAVHFGGDGEAHYCGRWFAPRVAVRLLRTRKPTSKEYDSWARAPVLETGPSVSVEIERRTTAGGGLLLVWRFAFFALGDRRPRSMTRGPGPSCHRLGCHGARRARFSAACRGTSGRVFLEKGFTPRVAVTLSHSLQPLRPFAFELSAPFASTLLCFPPP
jgi:hypothetical protein